MLRAYVVVNLLGCYLFQNFGNLSEDAFNQLFGEDAYVVLTTPQQTLPLQPALEAPQLNVSIEGAPQKRKFNFGHAGPFYPGWFPFPYAFEEGIVAEIGEKYGAEIEDFGITSVVKSMVQFVAGEIDIVIMAMLDAQLLPLVELFQRQADSILGQESGVRTVNTTAIIVGSWSNGNDGIISTKANSLQELAGQKIFLDPGTSYYYYLYRALEQANIDPNTIQVQEMDLFPRFEAFLAGEIDTIVVNEPLLDIALQSVPGAKILWTSDEIPYEMIDMIVTHDWIIQEHPEVPLTLVEAWYEANQRIIDNSTSMMQSFEWMSQYAELSVEEVNRLMLNTTFMFWEAPEALEFITSNLFKQSIERTRNYIFSQGIFNGIFESVQDFGIAVNDTIVGDPQSVQLRIDPTFTQKVAMELEEF